MALTKHERQCMAVGWSVDGEEMKRRLSQQDTHGLAGMCAKCDQPLMDATPCPSCDHTVGKSVWMAKGCLLIGDEKAV